MSKKLLKATSSDILGTTRPVLKESGLCSACQKPIAQPRIEALKLMGVIKANWTHTQCSQVSKVKGIYMGEVGTSQIRICDRVYDDSVRSVFKKAEAEIEETVKPIVEED